MKSFERTLTTIIAIIAMLGAFGCANSADTPLAPEVEGDILLTDTSYELPEGRALMGYYTVKYDILTHEIEVIDRSRELEARYNIMKFMAPNMDWVWECYIPEEKLWIFDLELTNPTQWTAYDVRVFVMPGIHTDDYIGNADDYSNHWQNLAPQWLNPFKAYGTYDSDRAFTPNMSDTQQFWYYMGEPEGQYLLFDLVVECSFPGNCDDPYEISGQYMSGPVTSWTPATIMVDVLVHGGDATYVWVDTTPITGDITYLDLAGGPTWYGSILNSEYAMPGTYRCKITADAYYGPVQEYVDDQLHDFIEITVQ